MLGCGQGSGEWPVGRILVRSHTEDRRYWGLHQMRRGGQRSSS